MKHGLPHVHKPRPAGAGSDSEATDGGTMKKHPKLKFTSTANSPNASRAASPSVSGQASLGASRAGSPSQKGKTDFASFLVGRVPYQMLLGGRCISPWQHTPTLPMYFWLTLIVSEPVTGPFPTPGEIRDAVPPNGITTKALIGRFRKRVPTHRTPEFTKMVKETLRFDKPTQLLFPK
jgi:hypothetical protein